MKLIRLFVLAIIIHQLSISNCFSQPGTWTWMSGDSALNSTGYSGVQGVPSRFNVPPSRYACGFWTDTAGNFWIYSGLNAPDDLWKFDPVTLEWTWMTGTGGIEQDIAAGIGVYDASNDPGALAYGMPTWVSPDNHLWLFGGLHNYASEIMNDNLWQYNPAINQWAWMGNFGPASYGTMGVGDNSTMPGGRQEGNSTWTDDNGNLWLFGGCDQEYHSYNDVWEYNVSTGVWTWMSGSNNLDDPGAYGVIGRPWNQAYPPGRSTNLSWKDAAGNFWLAGGTQHTNDLMFQDAWEFDPQNLEWTWVSGPMGEDTFQYGTNCVADSLNQTGPRYENRASWQVCADFVVTFDGFTDWQDTDYSPFNDMWGYQISTGEWTKINSWPTGGDYGTPGVTTVDNYPPARIGGVGFTGKDKSLWLFGGQNKDGFFSDVWNYVLDSACTGRLSCSRNCQATRPVITTEDTIFCGNTSTPPVMCPTQGFSYYQWNNGLSGTGGCFNVSQAGYYYVTVTDNNGCTAVSDTVHISTYPVPDAVINGNGVDPHMNDTLTTGIFASYQWIFNNAPIDSATNQSYIAYALGYYQVTVSDTNGCIDTSASFYYWWDGLPVINALNAIRLCPNPSAGNWQLTVGNELPGSELEIYDAEGRLVFKSEIRNLKSEITLDVASGVYIAMLKSATGVQTQKLVVER